MGASRPIQAITCLLKGGCDEFEALEALDDDSEIRLW